MELQVIPFRGQLALFGGLDDKNQAVEGGTGVTGDRGS